MVFIICLRLLFCEWQILGEFEICWIGINFQIGKLLLTSFDLVGDLQQPSWNIALDEVQPTFYKQPTLIKTVARAKEEGFFVLISFGMWSSSSRQEYLSLQMIQNSMHNKQALAENFPNFCLQTFLKILFTTVLPQFQKQRYLKPN